MNPSKLAKNWLQYVSKGLWASQIVHFCWQQLSTVPMCFRQQILCLATPAALRLMQMQHAGYVFWRALVYTCTRYVLRHLYTIIIMAIIVSTHCSSSLQLQGLRYSTSCWWQHEKQQGGMFSCWYWIYRICRAPWICKKWMYWVPREEEKNLFITQTETFTDSWEEVRWSCNQVNPGIQTHTNTFYQVLSNIMLSLP